MADAAVELEEGSLVRSLKDLFAGAAGGVAQVLIGMRFSPTSLCAAVIEIGVFYLVTCHGQLPLPRKLWWSLSCIL